MRGPWGCQGGRALGPERREGWVLGWQHRIRAAFFFSQSFVELAVAAKLPGESHWFAVGNTQAVVLGALCVSNPVLCVLSLRVTQFERAFVVGSPP